MCGSLRGKKKLGDNLFSFQEKMSGEKDKVCSREWEDQSGKQFSFLIKMYASHIAYCICIRTIKSKSAKECLTFNEKSMDPGKRKWCHLTAGRSIWKAISLSCTSFTILFELPALHIASLYQGNQKQICQMTSPLKLQIKGNWHWKLSKLRPTLTYPAKRVWCRHFIESLTERKVQKPSLGWKVMNCWRDPVDKK